MKIIRTRQAKIIEENEGKRPLVTRFNNLADTNVVNKLFAEKFVEEANEVAGAILTDNNSDNIVEELADLLQLIEDFALSRKIVYQDIISTKIAKASKKGSYVKYLNTNSSVPCCEIVTWDNEFES
jgi:predicted house-cleaning noncanonical NTP pyrophosphatase (MazG superfamily)